MAEILFDFSFSFSHTWAGKFCKGHKSYNACRRSGGETDWSTGLWPPELDRIDNTYTPLSSCTVKCIHLWFCFLYLVVVVWVWLLRTKTRVQVFYCWAEHTSLPWEAQWLWQVVLSMLPCSEYIAVVSRWIVEQVSILIPNVNIYRYYSHRLPLCGTPNKF